MCYVGTCRCDIQTVTWQRIFKWTSSDLGNTWQCWFTRCRNCIFYFSFAQCAWIIQIFRYLDGLGYCWGNQSSFNFLLFVIAFSNLNYNFTLLYSEALSTLYSCVGACKLWKKYFFSRLVLSCCGIWTVSSVLWDCSRNLITAKSLIHKDYCNLECLS